MKTKRLVLIITLSVLFLFMIFYYFTSINVSSAEIKPDKILEKKIEIEASKNESIDFKEISNFDYDNMSVVTPYTNVNEYLASQNIINANIDSSIEYRDDINLIVFTLKNKLITYVIYPRTSGEFDIKKSTTFPSNKHKFEIIESNDSNEYRKFK